MKSAAAILVIFLGIVFCKVYSQNSSAAFNVLPAHLHPKTQQITPEELRKIFFNTPYTTTENQPLLDSLANLAKIFAAQSNSVKEKAALYRCVVIYYYQTADKPDSIFTYSNKLLAELEKDTLIKKDYYGTALVIKGTSLAYMQQYEQAINTFQQGLDYADKFPGQLVTKSLLLGKLGEMYLNLNNNKLCIEYTERSQSLKAPLIDTLLQRDVFGYCCNITAAYINEYYSTGNRVLLDSARKKLFEGFAAQRAKDTPALVSIFYLMQSKIECAKEDYVSAKKCIDISTSPNALSNDIYAGYVKDERLAIKGLITLKLGKDKEALQLIGKANLNNPMAQNAFIEVFYKEMYAYYKDKKMYPQALDYHEKLLSFIQKRKVLENRGVVYEAEKRYSSEQIKSQLLQSRLDVTEQKQKLTGTVYVALSLAAILCTVIAFFYYRGKKNRLLAIQQTAYTAIVNEKKLQLEQQVLQLEDYQEKLEKDYQLKNRLISIIGHDIITPLKFINRVAKSILDKKDEKDRVVFDETFRLIVDATANLQSMASNMLAWIKHHDKNMQFIAATFELKNVVKSVMSNAATMAEIKNIALVNSVADDIVLVQYKDLLQTLLLQFIINSIKYSHKGIVQVTALAEGNEVHITVADEGIGISESMIEELLHSNKSIVSEDNELKGQGFGFLIIKDMLKIMNGKMSICSKMTEGTSITVSIPQNITEPV